MDLISFRCTSCKQVLKVSSDKAGRKAKCVKCGKDLTIPAAQPPAQPPSLPAVADDEDQDEGGYGLLESHKSPELALAAGQEDKKKPVQEKKDQPAKFQPEIRHKTIQHHEDWQKFQLALILVFAGVCAWGLAFSFQVLFVAIGSLQGPVYNAVVEEVLLKPAQGAAVVEGQPPAMDRGGFIIGLIIGLDYFSLGRMLIIIAHVCGLLQGLLGLAGYSMCIGVPDRYGTRGLAFALLGVCLVNLLLSLLFKLLPFAGAMNYAMVPLVGPELAMLDANVERLVPLHAAWAYAPFWETFLTFLLLLVFFAEPVLFCLFLRAAGQSWKDEGVEQQSLRLLQVVFGQLFILVAYYVLSLSGTSEVVVTVLRIVYFLWVCFLLGFIIFYAKALLQTRGVLDKYLVASEEEQERAGREEREDSDDD